MLVELIKLKPNPFREFAVDPIDEANAARLAESIEEYGFWGGIVCRKGKNCDIEIGAGHHRIEAAMRTGIKTADLFIGDLDDESMIRVYATENATQRGNSSTSTVGSVASAIRFLTKSIMSGTEVTPACRSRNFNFDYVRRNLTNGAVTHAGLGEPVILDFLKGVPGVNQSSVETQLANLRVKEKPVAMIPVMGLQEELILFRVVEVFAERTKMLDPASA